jgi:hypothetical protein
MKIRDLEMGVSWFEQKVAEATKVIRLWPSPAEEKRENTIATKERIEHKGKSSLLCALCALLWPIHFPLSRAILPAAKCQRTSAGAPHLFHTTTLRRERKSYYSTTAIQTVE